MKGDSCRAGVSLSLVLALPLGWVCLSVACLNSDTAETLSLLPLTYAFDSPGALAESFLDALRRQDVETLGKFALTEEEFRLQAWPELPSSWPERNVPFEYAWGDLHQKSMSSLRRTIARYGGKALMLLTVEFAGETTPYQTFRVHRDARLRVRDEEKGEEMLLDLFGSVLEKDGRFKLFSYVTD